MSLVTVYTPHLLSPSWLYRINANFHAFLNSSITVGLSWFRYRAKVPPGYRMGTCGGGCATSGTSGSFSGSAGASVPLVPPNKLQTLLAAPLTALAASLKVSLPASRIAEPAAMAPSRCSLNASPISSLLSRIRKYAGWRPRGPTAFCSAPSTPVVPAMPVVALPKRSVSIKYRPFSPFRSSSHPVNSRNDGLTHSSRQFARPKKNSSPPCGPGFALGPASSCCVTVVFPPFPAVDVVIVPPTPAGGHLWALQMRLHASIRSAPFWVFFV
mmetsp:Transcript_21574/g.54464  ORF Transcript_21574/g.54464 Transcript_21574/m.54464 type:complete len:270 (-) Transcript_21574:1028-1837(-)